jgi:hypothetical protein
LLPSENKPLTPITLCDAFVVLRVEVERRHRLDILFSQLRSEKREAPKSRQGLS